MDSSLKSRQTRFLLFPKGSTVVAAISGKIVNIQLSAACNVNAIYHSKDAVSKERRSSPNTRKTIVGPWRNKAIAPYEPSALSPLSPPGVNESYPGVKLPTALLFVFPAQAERTLARNFSASVFNLLLSTDSP